jgi:MFS family permease
MPTRPRRGMRGFPVASALVVVSVAAFATWMMMANSQENAAVHYRDTHDDICVPYHPSAAVWSLFSVGLVCALIAVIIYGVLRGRPGRRPRPILAVAAVVVLVVQALVFYVQYSPDPSAVSGGFLSSSFCSGG